MKTYCKDCPLLGKASFGWWCALQRNGFEYFEIQGSFDIYSESCPLQSITYQKEDGALVTFKPEKEIKKEIELPPEAKYGHWM